MSFNIKDYLSERKTLIEQTLDELLPPGDSYPESIHRAMRYSLFAGGKRIRPILTLASAAATGGKEEVALRPACAIECIHTYSLIHDDLPALDNDDLRRGQPTCHKKFGEATAILAGSALLSEAFRILARFPEGTAHAETRTRVVEEITLAIGPAGMIGGQAVDLEAQAKSFTEEEITYIHLHKTGALVSASMKIGGVLAGAEETTLRALEEAGRKLGLAFQIIDDILNVEGDPTALGKAAGSDSALKKATFPSLLGVEASRKRAAALTDEILETMKPWGEDAEPLRAIARHLLKRES